MRSLEANVACPFCNIDTLRDRIFYENDKWIAFLAAPFHKKGHSIISEKPCCSVCPQVDRRGWGDLHCFGSSIGEVTTAIAKHYNPKDILFWLNTEKQGRK
jgi:diadenosine tetraphosphate (Ap4A) HIT family hydrolase